MSQDEFNYFKGINEQPAEGVFDNVLPANEASPATVALPNKTMIMSMAKVNASKNPSLQMSEELLQQTRDAIESGQEMSEKYKMAAERSIQTAAVFNKLKNSNIAGIPEFSPEDVQKMDETYRGILAFDVERKAKGVAEAKAIENIQAMAARDPVQAKVLLDNLQFGGATEVHYRNLLIQTHLLQRAEELDLEHNATGWGRTALNFALSMIPTNYNFARTGVVAGADTGISDWVLSGEGLRKQSETLYSNLVDMDEDEIAEYLSANGPLMKSIRENASTFGSFDPTTAIDVLDGVKGQSDDSRVYSNLWGGIEIAGSGVVGAVSSLTKTLVRAGAKKEAINSLANAADVLVKEGEEAVTRKTGVTVEELKTAQTTSHVDPSLSEEFSAPLALDLATREESIAKAAEMIPDVIREFRLSTPEDIANAYEKLQDDIVADIARPIKDFKPGVEVTVGGNELRFMEITVGNARGIGGYAQKSGAVSALKNIGRDGVTFRAEDGQWYAKAKVYMAEANGFHTSPLHEPTQGFISSLTGRFWRSSARTTDEGLQGKSNVAGSAIARADKEISDMTRKSYESIPKESRDVVVQIATIGSNHGKWWTEAEFRDLAKRYKGGREATDGEIRVYKELVDFNNMDLALRNDHLYSDKVLQGFENAKFVAKGVEFNGNAKVNTKPVLKPTDRVFNASDNIHYTAQNNPLTDADFKEFINRGYVLVEPENAIELLDGTTVKKVLIKRADLEIGPLKRSQVAYAEGGHRLYAYETFVKQASDGIQPDTGTKFLRSPKTWVTAKNIAEGRKWAATMEAARLAVKTGAIQTAQELDDLIFKGEKAFPSGTDFMRGIENGSISKNHPFEALHDRELPSAYTLANDTVENFTNLDEKGFNGYYRTTGKMYTSHKGEILKDTLGEIAPTIDPYEALTTSLKQITRVTGLHNYKTEALEKFINTFKNDLDFPTHLTSQFEKFDGGVVKKGTSLERRNFIEAQRFAIRNVLSYETPFERTAQEMWRSLAEAALGTGDNAARVVAHDAINWMKTNNPVAAIRGWVFDDKLGLFNVGQFFIQTSTMASALALSPKSGIRGIMSAPPLHIYLLKNGSENVLDVLAKNGVGKLAGFATADEFKEYARYVRKSGFMTMNGSHAQIGQNGPTAVFASLGDKTQRIREAGRFFFHSAEVWNRLTSIRIAWDETLAKGLKPNDPGFAGNLLRLADDYSVNMTHESAARWQKGALSIPTQFWAYNIRMMDAMTGKRFTAAQKMRLISMNVFMAGAAGYPVTEGISYYIHKSTGQEPDMDTVLGTLDRGMMDKIHHEVTGADVRIGEKMGTGGWVRDTLQTMFGASEYGEKPFAEMMGGASYSIAKSMGETFFSTWKYAIAESGGDMGEYALTGDAFLKMMQEVATINNVTKAVIAANFQTYSSKSGTLYTGLPENDAVYIALGFRPQEVVTLGYRMSYLKDKKTTIKEAADQIFKWRQEGHFIEDKKEENMKKANAFLRLLPPDIRADVHKNVQSRKENETLYMHIEKKFNQETGQVSPQPDPDEENQ